jgi:acetyl-CoA carboxylase biotin carboxyl carrier protein
VTADPTAVEAVEAEVDGTAQPTLDALVDSLGRIVRSVSRPPARVAVRFGDASIEVDWTAMAAPVGPAAVVDSPDPADEDDTFAVTAPTVGTFYRAPEPGAPPFVDVGDTVHVGQQVGIVEAMKLMNPIEADRAGRVVAVPVGDAEPVEYGQPLILLAPIGAE